jgi:hypothetical protein
MEVNGLREQVRQVERRQEESAQDRRELWKSNGNNQRSSDKAHVRIDGIEKDVVEVKDGQTALNRRFAWVIGALFTLSLAVLSAAIVIALAVR